MGAVDRPKMLRYLANLEESDSENSSSVLSHPFCVIFICVFTHVVTLHLKFVFLRLRSLVFSHFSICAPAYFCVYFPLPVFYTCLWPRIPQKLFDRSISAIYIRFDSIGVRIACCGGRKQVHKLIHPINMAIKSRAAANLRARFIFNPPEGTFETLTTLPRYHRQR